MKKIYVIQNKVMQTYWSGNPTDKWVDGMNPAKKYNSHSEAEGDMKSVIESMEGFFIIVELYTK